MPAPRFLARHGLPLALLAVSLTTEALSAAGEPPVPPLGEQLARARQRKDHESTVEIARRELEAPGADAPGLLLSIFQAQLALRDFPRANETLERLRKASPPPAPSALAELRGDLAYARAKPSPSEENGGGNDEDSDDKDDASSKTVESKPLDQALAAWREAVAADPADLPGLEGKIADALDQAGRWGEAAGAYRAVLRLVPGHAARQARLAVCLLNSGHAAEADAALQAAVKADAADQTVKAAAPLFDRLRPQLPALGRLEARIAAGDLSNSRPGDVDFEASTVASASLERALSLFRAGVPAGALVDAERAARETRGASLAVRLLQAQCLWQLGRTEEAAALGVARMGDRAWFDDTERCNRLRKADDAPRLSAAVPAARAHTVRATILLSADQPVLALEEAEQAHGLNESQHLRLDDPEVVYAVALLRNDRAEDALLAARRATEYAPNNPDGWAIWGRVEQETRADFTPAVAHLTRALNLREEPLWLRRRETCLRSLGRNAEADRDARRLAQLPPAS